jgi:hypothetical protein
MLRRVKYIKHPLTAGIPLKQKKKRGSTATALSLRE